MVLNRILEKYDKRRVSLESTVSPTVEIQHER